MTNLSSKKIYARLPDTPGVYLMKNVKGEVLYIGKAGNLKRRVSSYFLRPHEYRIQKLVGEIRKIDFKKTDTAIEALILEAELIKKYQPPFNVREKDDTSFLYVEITKEQFPRVLLIRGNDLLRRRPAPLLTEHPHNRSARKREERSARFSAGFGPFTSASDLKYALRIIRKIFPFQIHAPEMIGKFKRPCFEYELGLCPGTCAGSITRAEYLKNIRNIKLFFEGKKQRIVKALGKEMKAASKKLEFETAEKLKRKIFALKHIRDIALIQKDEINDPGSKIQDPGLRIEGYDISNISGTSAVGVMVVFKGDEPDKSGYRRFRIRTVTQSNDIAMLKEMLMRRFRRTPEHHGWDLPNVILVDGGVGQVNAARNVLREYGLRIPIVGIAKGPLRKKNEFIGVLPRGVEPNVLIRVRDEAHRFAIGYHKRVRGRTTFE